MSDIGRYLLSVIAAAMITSVATRVIGDKGTLPHFIKLFSGIFLIITLVSPLKEFSLAEIPDYFSGIEADASSLSAYADMLTKSEMERFIKEKTESYILDKASDFDLDITVDVEVSASDVPVPLKVSIQGIVPPYSKQQLSGIITNDLGISKEHQLWISKQVS